MDFRALVSWVRAELIWLRFWVLVQPQASIWILPYQNTVMCSNSALCHEVSFLGSFVFGTSFASNDTISALLCDILWSDQLNRILKDIAMVRFRHCPCICLEVARNAFSQDCRSLSRDSNLAPTKSCANTSCDSNFRLETVSSSSSSSSSYYYYYYYYHCSIQIFGSIPGMGLLSESQLSYRCCLCVCVVSLPVLCLHCNWPLGYWIST
jgi:hypothetical protein